MAAAEKKARHCKVTGCHAWTLRDEDYCASHYNQWQENLRVGVPDPEPRTVRRHRRLCAARSCRRLAVENSLYCPTHAAQVQADEDSAAVIAGAFDALVDRLDSAAPDSVTTILREQSLLDAARRILVAHARQSSRSGWRAISSMTFIRLWLASATTATELAKTRFLMENATGADLDRLLDSVYSRLDQSAPPEQRPLPGLLAPPPTADQPLRPTALTSPEEQLAEWLLEATPLIGTALVEQALRAASQSLALPPTATLEGLATALPTVVHDQPPDPIVLSERLSTLSAIVAGGPTPDPVATRAILEASTHG